MQTEMTVANSRLLKKAHLRRPTSWVPRPLAHSLRRTRSTPGPTCGGYPAPGTHLMGDAAGHPSEGWVVWTFLSSLGEDELFSTLLVADPVATLNRVIARRLRRVSLPSADFGLRRGGCLL